MHYFFLSQFTTQPWVSSEDEDGAEPMDEDLPSKPKNGDLSEYNLDEYDEEADSSALGPFTNLKGLTYYRNNDEDPYITLKEVSPIFLNILSN